MSDTPTPPPSTEKTVAIDSKQLRRLWTLTLISVSLNTLIIAAFLVGAILHHHGNKRHGFGGRGGGPEGYCQMAGPRGGFGHGYQHRFGGMGPMHMGGRGSGMMGGGTGMMEDGPGMMPGGPRMMGGSMGMNMRGERGMRGMNGGGPDMGDMMGGHNVGPVDPARMTDMLLNRLTSELTLSDDQKAKVKPIIQEQVTQMQKDMEARRAAMQKAAEDTKAKLKPLLNADQQKQLEAIPLPGQKPPAAPASK